MTRWPTLLDASPQAAARAAVDAARRLVERAEFRLEAVVALRSEGGRVSREDARRAAAAARHLLELAEQRLGALAQPVDEPEADEDDD